MDWQRFADELQAWVARTAQIPCSDVVWTGEPLGMVKRPCAFLNLLGSAGQGISGLALNADEIRYIPQGPDQDAQVRVVGNRAVTLNVLVHTRDGTPWGRAFRYLERLRNALFFPSTLKLFSDIGISLDGPGVLVDLNRLWDLRKESSASLDLKLLYTFDTHCDCGADGMVPETIGTIEHVRYAGTVHTAFNRDETVVETLERQVDK